MNYYYNVMNLMNLFTVTLHWVSTLYNNNLSFLYHMLYHHIWIYFLVSVMASR